MNTIDYSFCTEPDDCIDVAELTWPSDAPGACLRLAGTLPEFAWLDSAGQHTGWRRRRRDVIAALPLAVIEQAHKRPARLTVRGEVMAEASSFWRLWADVHAQLPRAAAGQPLSAAWIGYLGFELVDQLERLPPPSAESNALPLGRMALVDQILVLDHEARRAWRASDLRLRTTIERRFGRAPLPIDLAECWRAACAANGVDRSTRPPATRHAASDQTRAEYVARVRRIQEYIAAGDVYQVNLAQRIRCGPIGDIPRAYASLRRANPAPYAALLHWPDASSGEPCAVLSASPECFLDIDAGRVLTSPIKGTRPRGADAAADDANAAELLASAKDAAELAMIVDLHRNDLGRVCRPGTIVVENARRVEMHPSVIHTIADVRGELRADSDAIDVVKACFPAGSVTGAPKIRALEIIRELEPVARGAYCGAVGLLAHSGDAAFNVAIRTVQVRGLDAWLHVGGGVVADSDPDAEYDETLAKSRGVLSGLAAHRAPDADSRCAAQPTEL